MFTGKFYPLILTEKKVQSLETCYFQQKSNLEDLTIE